MLSALLSIAVFASHSWANVAKTWNSAESWEQVLKEAKGQTVYFNAWGGSEQINDYIRWTGKEIKQRYGITLKHVKVDDIASVVSRVLSEKTAGRLNKGTVDLIWINGENFKSMKDNRLLYGPFSNNLPSIRFIDPRDKPTTVVDFGEPVEGFEAPWGMAQLVFIYDSSQLSNPPKNAQELLAFARQHPGQVTYPLPPDFVGTTFLKQLLYELIKKPEALLNPVSEQEFDQLTQPLWTYLDQLHPLLWRKGKSFPRSNLAMTPLLDDREIALSMTFNPSYASSAIKNGELAKTVRTYVHQGGTLGNTHFLAIPFNSSAKAAAQVTINFLLSPEAQLRKSDPNIWGDPTVLTMGLLPEADQKKFNTLPKGIATLSSEQLGVALPEPHNSWVSALEKAWLKRYR